MFFCHRKTGKNSREFSVILIVLSVMALTGFLLYGWHGLSLLGNVSVPKTFWRKDLAAVVKYHIRDYRVPWSAQLLAAIALARKHGEPLYLEDTPSTIYARNRGNVNPVDLSEEELWLLRRVSGFLAEHCTPDMQHADSDAMTRMFPTDEIAQLAKDLLDYAPGTVRLQAHDQFYLHYLLGIWYRELGIRHPELDTESSSRRHFQKALESADCVVICPVMMWDERSGEVVPVKNTRFPFGVTTKHRTEQGDEFSLWYPAVTTDQHGLISLPVYREMIADPALVAVDTNGTRFTVETFGLRDIAKPYRFGMYVPVVLSGEQHSQLTCPPGLEEELRYAKRPVFANLSLEDATVLCELGIVFKTTNQFQVEEGGVLMPTLRYADEFAGLHFRGLTRTELTRQLRNYCNEQKAGQIQSLTVTDGDNFIVSQSSGRTYLCRFFVSNDPQQTGTLDVWDLGWIRQR